MPFSKEELKNFKQKNILKVTEQSQDSKTVYYFNSNGQLYFQKYFAVKKKKREEKNIPLDSVRYKYNINGDLIVRQNMGHVNYYDSIEYNSIGRVIYYLSYNLYKEKNKASVKEIEYELIAERINDLTTTFIDKRDTIYKTWYVYDNNNEIKKTYTSNSIDSLAKIDISPGEYSVKYFYKVDTAKYKLGQEYFYKNNRLSVCTYYERYYYDALVAHITERFLYNENGKLIQKTIGDYYGTKEVYFYNPEGLLYQRYILYRENLREYSEYYYSKYN